MKGRSGARFKKATSAGDEEAILRSWGLEPDDLVPASDRVALSRQRRDAEQRELIVDFDIDPAKHERRWFLAGVAFAVASLWRRARAR